MYYLDYNNSNTKGVHFQYNDLLLVIKTYLTMIPIYIFFIKVVYVGPKADRCAQIFGVNSNFDFALRVYMYKAPIGIVV